MLASQIDKERRENRNINTELTLKLIEIQTEVKKITDERDLYKKKLVEAIDDKDMVKMIKTFLKETGAVRENQEI